LVFSAKYQPYDALRQRFWRQYLKQYDADDTNALSHIEITSMLDSLGSTLTHSTISSFFTRFGKNHHTDELSFEEAIQCLETELGRPSSEKKRLDSADAGDTSVVATPVLMASDGRGNEVKLDELDFSGPGMVERHHDNSADRIPALEPKPTVGMQQPLIEVAAPPGSEGTTPESSDVNEDAAGAGAGGQRKKKKLRFRRKKGTKHPQGDSESSSGNNTAGEDGGMPAVERVINVKSCPLCHRPRMNSKAEMDIITHLAVCASQDWKAVDKIVVGNFVTASQAQRKWYTKVLSKVSSGDYKLGAVSLLSFIESLDLCSSFVTELGQYHRSEPNDWSAGRRENASLCQARYSTLVQGGFWSDGRS
jgi:phosphatidylserine decarboxylase